MARGMPRRGEYRCGKCRLSEPHSDAYREDPPTGEDEVEFDQFDVPPAGDAHEPAQAGPPK